MGLRDTGLRDTGLCGYRVRLWRAGRHDGEYEQANERAGRNECPECGRAVDSQTGRQRGARTGSAERRTPD
ncbi:hypothetical protein [Gordonia terrae]|uniref:hypothetical protein n=1 Tax=Gordonia terrae TaxID=2055 RepID=UPI003F6BF7B6